MRNKEEELKYQNIINKVKKNVEKHFPEIDFSLECGAYIQAELFPRHLNHLRSQLL